ncbi:hypothetical protein KY284_012221 [Solanum tuberosum]|nr:hypothetical protein KY284_012221 [Solanum tuberosum]
MQMGCLVVVKPKEPETQGHQIHSKKRNRLALSRLNDLVYNRTLKFGCTEDKEDELVYEGGDLAWGTVVTTVGANENIYGLLGEVLQVQGHLTRIKEYILHLQVQVLLDPN